jgi:hypothetical protein
MAMSVIEQAKARDTLARLLAGLHLAGHRFEISQEGEEWAVAIECAAPSGWLTVRLTLPRDQLRDAGDAQADPAARAAVLARLRERLSGCTRAET